jgi:hypothetical protein
MIEKRRFVRFDVSLPIKWRKITDDSDDMIESKSKNISAGGLCLIIKEKEIYDGDILELQIELPTGETFYLEGQVIWVSEFRIIRKVYENWYAAGIEFINIYKEDRERIKEVIAEMISNTYGEHAKKEVKS